MGNWASIRSGMVETWVVDKRVGRGMGWKKRVGRSRGWILVSVSAMGQGEGER